MLVERWRPPEGAVEKLLKKLELVPGKEQEARVALHKALGFAGTFSRRLKVIRKPVPRELYENIDEAARRLLAAMRKLERLRHLRWINDIDGATAQVQHIQKAAERGAQLRKDGTPPRLDKAFVAKIAARFLLEYSPATKPNTYPLSPFGRFLESFWKTVADAPTKPGVLGAWQIRRTAEAIQAGNLPK